MWLRVQLVLWYILSCIRLLTPPWRYFQLNAPYFNEEKGLFSKLEIDACIPEHWRLEQQPLANSAIPVKYPVFIKPEWGQNGHGIKRADDARAFLKLQKRLLQTSTTYLVQQAAEGRREFEIFFIREGDSEQFAVLSAAETLCSAEDPYPVNSILNPDTRYRDLCPQLTDHSRQQLWKMLNPMGHFRIARVGIRAEGLDELINGEFKIIEINLFIPLPLRLLDPELAGREKRRFIRSSMLALAKATRAIPKNQQHKPLFSHQTAAHYRVKS